MAATNVLKAVMDKWATLTAANFPGSAVPPIALDDMPVTSSDGSQVYPVYAILRDGGMTPLFDFERNVVEATELTIEVYGTLADCAQVVEAAKYNGGTIQAGSGLDFASLTFEAGAGARVAFEVVRTREQWSYSGLSKAGQRFYRAELGYRATTRRSL
jgi:hypothetical protein